MRIFNTDGQTIALRPPRDLIGQINEPFNMEKAPHATYYIEVTIDGFTTVRKVDL